MPAHSRRDAAMIARFIEIVVSCVLLIEAKRACKGNMYLSARSLDLLYLFRLICLRFL